MNTQLFHIQLLLDHPTDKAKLVVFEKGGLFHAQIRSMNTNFLLYQRTGDNAIIALERLEEEVKE